MTKKPSINVHTAPQTPRMVISWFGGDIENFELISEETFREWVSRVKVLAIARGWAIERLGNPIDLIIGNRERSIMPAEFFKFQREWEALNEEFAFRFTGAIQLMGENHEFSSDAPCELYIKGRKKYGDSIGRPQRKRCGGNNLPLQTTETFQQ